MNTSTILDLHSLGLIPNQYVIDNILGRTAVKDTIYMTNTTGGSNKFYEMTDLGNGKWKARWGKIGGTPSNMEYDMSVWDKKYQEKIKKGYKVIRTTKNTSTPSAAPPPVSTAPPKKMPMVPMSGPPKKVEIDPKWEKKVKEIGDTVRKSKRSAMTVDLQMLRDIEKRFFQTGTLTKKDMQDLNTLYTQYK